MPQQVRRTIGERLRKARLSAELTQQDVATDFVRSRQAVSSWESGKTLPTLPEFRELVTLYGVSADEILFGTGDIAGSFAQLIAKAKTARSSQCVACPQSEPSGSAAAPEQGRAASL